MNDIVFLNGAYVKLEKACISPTDRGFLFADGVYEVVKIYNGKIFTYQEHMQRLSSSLDKLKIKLPSQYNFSNIINNLLDLNKAQDTTCGVYIQVTRGAFTRSHNFPPGHVQPTVYAALQTFRDQQHWLKNGIKVVVRKDIRWQRCDIKSIALLPNTLMFQEAVETDAQECIFVRDGMVTEASHSNVLGIKQGKLFTHPLNEFILPGITRKVVIDVCKKLDIPVIEEAFSENDLYNMDELLLSGTGNEIMPVVQVENIVIGRDKPGLLTRQIQDTFFKLV